MESGEIPVQQEIVKPIDKIIEDRFSQDKTDRFIEYVTGLRADDPELPNRLASDQERIRAKYGLPDRRYRFENPSEYERLLRKILEDNDVSLRSRFDCGDYIEEYPSTKAVFMDRDNARIGVSIDKTDLDTYIRSISVLEHETIHALQYKRYPEMSSELMEYEAYVSEWSSNYYLKNPDTLRGTIGFFMLGSVNRWYEEESKRRGVEIKPVWNDPEYFLTKVDGISEDAIVKYKTEHQVDTEK